MSNTPQKIANNSDKQIEIEIEDHNKTTKRKLIFPEIPISSLKSKELDNEKKNIITKNELLYSNNDTEENPSEIIYDNINNKSIVMKNLYFANITKPHLCEVIYPRHMQDLLTKDQPISGDIINSYMMLLMYSNTYNLYVVNDNFLPTLRQEGWLNCCKYLQQNITKENMWEKEKLIYLPSFLGARILDHFLNIIIEILSDGKKIFLLQTV